MRPDESFVPKRPKKVSAETRLRGFVVASMLMLLCGSACTSETTDDSSGGDRTLSPTVSATAAVNGVSKEIKAEDFSADLFDDDSANVDNPWFPLEPGTRYVWEGRAFTDEGEQVDRRVVFIVTDLTKVVGGVRAVVGWDRDFNGDTVGESELIFYAQDKNGNVWHLGEYVEHWNEGELDGGRLWVVGDPEGARAGIAMYAEPRTGVSYSQGFVPPPWFWDDHARVSDVGVRNCVPVRCFDDSIVVEEFELRFPGAFQLKYYARGVGNIRVGWRGPNDDEREVMVLKEFHHLSPQALAGVRAEVLEQENRGYAYARTQPMESRPEGQ
jgi:hypothetical protein